ncbi:hypothetical protein AOLI_G00248930 [Acnodon oligacanthus]
MQFGTSHYSIAIALGFQTAWHTEALDLLHAAGSFHPPVIHRLRQRLILSKAPTAELLLPLLGWKYKRSKKAQRIKDRTDNRQYVCRNGCKNSPAIADPLSKLKPTFTVQCSEIFYQLDGISFFGYRLITVIHIKVMPDGLSHLRGKMALIALQTLFCNPPIVRHEHIGFPKGQIQTIMSIIQECSITHLQKLFVLNRHFDLFL